MHNAEKSIYNPLAEASIVKDRIFNRFFDVHSYLNGMLKEAYPMYQFTNLELTGISAKLSMLDDKLTFEDISDELQAVHDLLLHTILSKPNERNLKYYESGVTLLHLIRFFDWCAAFGPKEDKAAELAAELEKR